MVPCRRGPAARSVPLCDPHGNLATFEPPTDDWAERLARTAAVAMGGSAVEVDYPCRSTRLGRPSDRRGQRHHGHRDRPRAARPRHRDGVAALVEHLDAVP